MAVFTGFLSIVIGFFILLLPVLITELSRPRDSLWGALLMVFGLTLFTTNERLYGSPMLTVLFSSLIIYRLLSEVSQYRWHQLTLEEKTSLKSLGRWSDSFKQTLLVINNLGSIVVDVMKLFKAKPKPSAIGKKWTRPEPIDEKLPQEPNQMLTDQSYVQSKNLISDSPTESITVNKPTDAS